MDELDVKKLKRQLLDDRLVPVSVLLPRGVKQYVDQIAFDQGAGLSTFIRYLITEYAARQQVLEREGEE